MKLLAKLYCRFFGHREPYKFQYFAWDVTCCTRCGKIFSKERVRRTFAEIYDDVLRNSGNQIW